jgi:hypothetical protein
MFTIPLPVSVWAIRSYVSLTPDRGIPGGDRALAQDR